MSEDVLVFWLIHLFIGLILPVMAYFGCCRYDNDQEQLKKTQQSEQNAPIRR